MNRVRVLWVCFLFSIPAFATPSFFRINAKSQANSFGSKTFTVWDVSSIFKQMPAVSDPSLKAVEANKIFVPGTVFFGFGLPNVYMAEVVDEDEIVAVAAKSLRREPTKIIHSRGNVQSGIFIVPTNLPPEAIDEIKSEALKRQGTTNLTCVRANCTILGIAGFTINGHNIASYMLPQSLYFDLFEYGLKYQGQTVKFKIVRTTPYSLEEYYRKINTAFWNTLARHKARNDDTDEAKELRKKQADEIRLQNESVIDSVQVKDYSGNIFKLYASEPSQVGSIARRMWGAHPIYRVPLDSPEFRVADFLPNILPEFPDPNPSCATWVKKKVLFAPPMVRWIRSQMTRQFNEIESDITEYDLAALIPIRTPENQNTYNIVITSNELIIAHNSVRYSLVDWILSKHVLISNYSKEVRFAGELWKSESGILYINANSGTYKPSPEALFDAVRLAHKVFPHLEIEQEFESNPPGLSGDEAHL